jgi:5,10-methylenetetrahydromethanopterin reductase
LTREVGLGIQGNRSVKDYARIAAMAEDYGFDVVTVFSDFLYQPAIAPLLILAQHSKTIRLGPACLNPFTLHPTEIAGQIAMLDQVSDGRAYLGLARGTWLEQAGMTPHRPVRALREAAAIVDLLLRHDARGYRGEIFSLAPGATLQYETRRPRVPLLIGTWSPQIAALAGEIADELKIGGTANPAMVGRMRSMIEVGTARARRPPESVGIVVGAVTVVDDDAGKARAAAESAARMYIDIVARLDSSRSSPGSTVALDDFAFAGSPEMIAERANLLFDAGARRVEFGAPHGLDQEQGIRLLGERVLPRLRH